MKYLMTSIALCSVFNMVQAKADARIRTVEYDPGQVITIYTSAGNPTLIQFANDETIVDADKGMLGMGDAKAWNVKAKSNNILLKPQASMPDTKMIVVTTKRTYAFEIKSTREKIEPTLIVRFTYPETRVASNDKKAELGTVVKINANYMKQGDAALSPSQVFDDGRFTYFRFNSTRELPVIYKMLPDGKEALTNSHMESSTGTIVVHETASKFMLRYGQAVLAIRNDGFKNGALNVAATTVPNAVRINREEH